RGPALPGGLGPIALPRVVPVDLADGTRLRRPALLRGHRRGRLVQPLLTLGAVTRRERLDPFEHCSLPVSSSLCPRRASRTSPQRRGAVSLPSVLAVTERGGAVQARSSRDQVYPGPPSTTRSDSSGQPSSSADQS